MQVAFPSNSFEVTRVETRLMSLKRVRRQAMKDTMDKDEQKFRFLIDGFPRNEDNLQGWNKVMDDNADVKFVLFFDCSTEVRWERWETRSGLVLCCSVAFKPLGTLLRLQVCISRCLERGKNSGRTDDNRESLIKR